MLLSGGGASARMKHRLSKMRIALYQPEIPQNTGTILRMGACLGVPVDIIEPCGFIWNDQKLRRAGMDYMDLTNLTRHSSWEKFWDIKKMPQSPHRVVLLDAKATTNFLDFQFEKDDILLIGKESSGVPQSVYDQVDHRVIIPMVPGCRSLNMAIAGAIVLTEALRQTRSS